MAKEKTNYLHLDQGKVIPYQISEGKKTVQLESGIYSLCLHPLGPMEYTIAYEPLIQKDNLINFKGSIMEKVTKIADKFFAPATIEGFKELKVTHKMGMLLEGVPGGGKTCLGMLIMKSLVEKYNAVCLDGTKMGLNLIKSAVDLIRRHQDNPIVMFVDEFDSRMHKEEEEWLPVLDGNESVGGTVFLGCTNYIDRIPSRIKDRKSRIKHVFTIDKLPMEVYVEYIKNRLPSLEDKIVSEFAFFSEEASLTMDQLKNALIDYKIDGMSIKKAIKTASAVKPETNEGNDDED